MRRLPRLLVFSRFALAPVAVLLALADERGLLVACLLFAFVGDVVDGKLARRLGVDDDRLRKLDSQADLLFWLGALGAAWVLEPEGLRARAAWIGLVLALEVATHGISWLRFGQGPANHAWATKLWGILLCASLTAIIGWGEFGLLFAATIGVGVVSLLDGLLILCLLPAWQRDVPSALHALESRRASRRRAPPEETPRSR